MKGFVPTPDSLVNLMVSKLFRSIPPGRESRVLDPGCGTGAFIEGIIRWCEQRHSPIPRLVGVELNPAHVTAARRKFASFPSVEIRHEDFLTPKPATYEYVVGNPPYVPITSLSEGEKATYRTTYATAAGRFDLYLLFFEQALRHLAHGGRLVFVTPEKYLYVHTAAPLRSLLARFDVEEIHLIKEDAFGSLVTYPTITSVRNNPPRLVTRVIRRDASQSLVPFPVDGTSWLPHLNLRKRASAGLTLADISSRISCGVATGADSVFVLKESEIPGELKRFAYPTVSGRELTPERSDIPSSSRMLIPYDRNGGLLSLSQIGALADFLSQPAHRERLLKRTCVSRKPWYAFHETPLLDEILQPKILCKDIGNIPHFWIDAEGRIVPRHSVYYIVPKDPGRIEAIRKYLGSETAREWLMAHSHRAANGFIRLQSSILKRLPVPPDLDAAKKPDEMPLGVVHANG